MSLSTILVIVGIAFVALLLLNRRALGNMLFAARAQVGELGRAVKNADPVANFKQAIDDGLDTIDRSKKSLETVATQLRSLNRQLDEGTTEKTRLENRIRAALSNGDPNKTAADYALQLEAVERNLKANQEQKARTQQLYDGFAKTIESNQKKVAEARREIADLGIQLEQSEREKELTRFAAEFDKGVDVGAGLADARAAIQAKIDANRAAGDVALSTSTQRQAELADDELERQQRADDILARFKQPAGTAN
jgi:phage shock protein A